MLQSFFTWVLTNYIEIFGALFGLLYIFLSIRQNIWCWPVGFITSALYVYVFFVTKFYADMGLQVYYLIVSVYGWYHWMYGGKSKQQDDLKPAWGNLRLYVALTFAAIALFAAIAFILVKFTDSEIPYWDAFTTAGSFIATWMLARKLIENWLVWILVDTVALGTYIYKELYATVALFLVYVVLAILGYLQWKRALNTSAS